MKYILPILFSIVSHGLFCQEIDMNSSYIKFDSKYLQNAIIEGIVTGIKGKATINTSNIESSQLDINIDITTINSGYEKRDMALLRKDILDTMQYPLIYFKSIKFEQNGTDYWVTGNLKIKETTKEIRFLFTLSEIPKKLIIKGKTTIDRFDYNIGENISTITAAREVNIYINFVLKIPAQ
jgi:polyisoprenoid-binding protein YceI